MVGECAFTVHYFCWLPNVQFLLYTHLREGLEITSYDWVCTMFIANCWSIRKLICSWLYSCSGCIADVWFSFIMVGQLTTTMKLAYL